VAGHGHLKDAAPLAGSIDGEYQITNQAAARFSGLLARYCRPRGHPAVERAPCPGPLYIAPDDTWSLACVIWDVGQRTPVH
jgi:hypothetical protein